MTDRISIEQVTFHSANPLNGSRDDNFCLRSFLLRKSLGVFNVSSIAVKLDQSAGLAEIIKLPVSGSLSKNTSVELKRNSLGNRIA